MYSGVVHLLAAALQKLCCMGVLCDYAQSRGVAVKPVNRAKSELGIEMSEIIPEGISLMPYGRVYGHTVWLIEHHKAVVLKGYRHIQTAVGL